MLRRLVKDESGLVLALVVIMIVLIGVLGAGFLVFVRSDLEAVVRANQGQRALEMADAGVEAGRRHLTTTDARPSSYDAHDPSDNSDWFGDAFAKRLDFDGDGDTEVSVGIRYLSPSENAQEATRPGHAPEVLPGEDEGAYPRGRHYFEVSARGSAGAAVRQVQAIYAVESLESPAALYATGDVTFTGDATVKDMSVFAGGRVENLAPSYISGEDLAYGDWTGEHNRVPRGVVDAGAAAVGTVTYAPASEEDSQKANAAGSAQRYGVRDFDADSDLAPVSSRDFAQNTWGTAGDPSPEVQPSNTITFPFATGDAKELVARLKQAALEQGNYVRKPGGDHFVLRDGIGPDDFSREATPETVYFVEFAGGSDESPSYGAKGSASYGLHTGSADGRVKGTIVVVNGDLNFTSDTADDFRGVVIVRDPDAADDTVMAFVKDETITLEGFANVEGDMFFSGAMDGVSSDALANGIPGPTSASLWGWRECYSADCR